MLSPLHGYLRSLLWSALMEEEKGWAWFTDSSDQHVNTSQNWWQHNSGVALKDRSEGESYQRAELWAVFLVIHLYRKRGDLRLQYVWIVANGLDGWSGRRKVEHLGKEKSKREACGWTYGTGRNMWRSLLAVNVHQRTWRTREIPNDEANRKIRLVDIVKLLTLAITLLDSAASTGTE